MALNDDWYLHPVSPWLVYQADNNQLLMEIQRELETATEPQTEQQQRECAARYNTELRRIRANFNAIREANGQEMQELNRRVAEINVSHIECGDVMIHFLGRGPTSP
jgi:hypothetical protein